MPDAYLIPSLLYGDKRKAARAWKKLLRTAWDAQSWEEALDPVEYVDVRDTDCEIIVDRLDGRFEHNAWHLHCVADAGHWHALPRGWSYEQMTDFICDGLTVAWIARAFLFGGWPWDLPPSRKNFALINENVRWLPETMFVAPRFCCGKPEGLSFGFKAAQKRWQLKLLGIASGSLPFDWSDIVARVRKSVEAAYLRYFFSSDIPIGTPPKVDLGTPVAVTMLLEYNVIEETDGRYRLTPEFAATLE